MTERDTIVVRPADGRRYLRIPVGVVHDFWNRSEAQAGALNVFMPGGFESLIKQWTTT